MNPIKNTEYDDENNLKWGKLIGPEECAKRGLDPHSSVPGDRNHPDWQKGIKTKTGRRESRLPVTLRTGQHQGKPAECGHAVLSHTAPRTHCQECWNLYFKLNVKLTYAMFAYLEKGEAKQIEEVHGKTFLKHFKRFVSHVQSLAPIVPEDAVSVGSVA